LKIIIGMLSLALALPISSVAASTDVNPTGHREERNRIAQQNAPINSDLRLQEHLHTLSSDSPLRALSTPARQRFVASIRFNSAGITTFSYRDIVNELTYSEAYRLLALFGAERTLGKLPDLRRVQPEDERIRGLSRQFNGGGEDDHPGYLCSGRATCSRSAQEICMTGC
jgi:hypothetical protein